MSTIPPMTSQGNGCEGVGVWWWTEHLVGKMGNWETGDIHEICHKNSYEN